MNFNLGELEELFEKINKIIDTVEKERYSDKRQQLYLSNGERITISMPNDSIAHLLGINTNYLISTSRFTNTKSFDLLREMCENAYRIHSLHKDGFINYDKLFSPYIFNKLESFDQNLKFDISEIELVCRYNSERAYVNGDSGEKYDYIIVKKYDDDKIGILGLVKKGTTYVPMTNQLYDSFEQAKDNLEKYLKNQEITIISGLNYYNVNTDYSSKYHTTLNQKSEKLSIMKNYRKLFNCTIDVSGDFDYTLDKLKSNRNNDYKDNELINTIASSIKSGSLIEEEYLETSLVPIIEAFNNFLCSSTKVSNSAEASYTQLKNDLLELRSKLTELQKEKNSLTTANESLQSRVTTLEEENTILLDTQDKIYQLIKPRN